MTAGGAPAPGVVEGAGADVAPPGPVAAAGGDGEIDRNWMPETLAAVFASRMNCARLGSSGIATRRFSSCARFCGSCFWRLLKRAIPTCSTYSAISTCFVLYFPVDICDPCALHR